MNPEYVRRWQWLGIAIVLAFLVWLLSPILLPFVLGALLAYMFDPLVDHLERWHLGRILATTIVFVALLVVVAGIIVGLVPLVQAQIVRLITSLPKYMHWVQTAALPWIELHLHIPARSFDTSSILAALQAHVGSVSSIVAGTLAKVSKSGFGIALWLTNLVLIPVVTFYLLRDWNIMVGHIDRMLPRQHRPTIVHLAHESNQVLGAFVRGQLLVMVGLGIIYGGGLAAIGLSVGPLIGMLAGLLSFVPYLGFIVGLAAALIAVLVQYGDWLHIGLLAIVFAVGQIMEGYVLVPKLVGDKIGLHPVAVIFAVLAGGYLFGFLGVLLALPMAAVAMVLLRFAYGRYTSSGLYDDERDGHPRVVVERDQPPPH